MLAAFLTTFFFAFSAVSARRSIHQLGVMPANFSRLIFAVLVFALVFHLILGHGLSSWAVFGWLFFSGIIGFGLGDIGTFGALRFLGSRVTVLFTQCLAVPVAGLLEWIWLGTTIAARDVFWITVILAGILMVLSAPEKKSPTEKEDVASRGGAWMLWGGILLGLLSCLGQAGGAVISRRAYEVAALAGEELSGGFAAYQRLIGGVFFLMIYLGLLRAVFPRGYRWQIAPGCWGKLFKVKTFSWMAMNGLSGPVLGVACYQWALAEAPSAVVLPIVATTPLWVMPLAWWLEGDRPTTRAIGGGVVAVTGALFLALRWA